MPRQLPDNTITPEQVQRKASFPLQGMEPSQVGTQPQPRAFSSTARRGPRPTEGRHPRRLHPGNSCPFIWTCRGRQAACPRQPSGAPCFCACSCFLRTRRGVASTPCGRNRGPGERQMGGEVPRTARTNHSALARSRGPATASSLDSPAARLHQGYQWSRAPKPRPPSQAPSYP